MKTEYFNTFLKDEYDNTSAIGDYSNEKCLFFLDNNISKSINIKKIQITLTSNSFASEKYGKNITLKNGIKIYHNDIKKRKRYIVGNDKPIKKNIDWLSYSCEIEKVKFNFGNEILRITFNFENIHDIILKKGESIIFELEDDFTELKNQEFFVEGFCDLNSK
jgi:hypothetical protein